MILKSFWQVRSLQEKRLLIFGGVIVFMAFLYYLAYQPLIEALNRYHQTIEESQSLLSWMQDNEQNVLHARGTTIVKDSISLFQRLEQTFQNFDSNAKPPTLSQVDDKTVSVTFEKVSFNKLIQSLTTLSQQHGIDVNMITVTRQDEEGFVSATVTFRRS